MLHDLHQEGAALDYPKGGMGKVVDVLVYSITKDGTLIQVEIERVL